MDYWKIADGAAKVVAAGAIVAAAVIANDYQQKMSATTLISQREQAESQLRASMFSDLIGPVVGPRKEGEEIDVSRERLLVELLALNFDEHFELKPLLMHVDTRLAGEEARARADNHPQAAQSLARERGSLRSIARRVIQRQIAALTQGQEKAPPGEDRAKVVTLTLCQQGDAAAGPCGGGEGVYGFGQAIADTSPDGKQGLTILITEPDWENQTVTVQTAVRRAGGPQAGQDRRDETSAVLNGFHLTWFDFPLTDNTLLGDGNRFALVLEALGAPTAGSNGAAPNCAAGCTAVVKLIWFPKDYFTPRERPINYQEFRSRLGI